MKTSDKVTAREAQRLATRERLFHEAVAEFKQTGVGPADVGVIVEAARGLCYFHTWNATDMVIWDNWRVLHSVSGSPPESGRCMHRTTIAGDYGLGRFETIDA